MTDKEIFEKQVIPIMKKVEDEIREKQVAEYKKEAFSLRGLVAGAAGPDGGMAADSALYQNLMMTGQWSSKKVEDYVAMVKNELQKNRITVTPEIERMMIDKMVRDQMPKSSIEYIMRKMAGNTIFGLPQEMTKSPLQQEIEERGEELYHPTGLEKGIGWGLGAAADFFTMGGSGIAGAVKFVGADLAVNTAISMTEGKNNEKEKSMTEPEKKVPLVVAPGHEEEYLAMQKESDEKKAKAEAPKQEAKEDPIPVEEQKAEPQNEPEPVQEKQSEEQPETQQTNSSGWQGLISSLGLSGISDIGRNAGYILAMLPDILVGMFTGKTKSLGLKDNMMPLASIMAGMFVKNPLLKMTLIGLGGANLINKAGHEQLEKEARPVQSIYRQYAEEQLDSRIEDPQIHGNVLIASIDRIPVTITLPDRVIDAYTQGALPLSTLANAVLQRTDQMQQITSAQERFEEATRTETRTISQR